MDQYPRVLPYPRRPCYTVRSAPAASPGPSPIITRSCHGVRGKSSRPAFQSHVYRDATTSVQELCSRRANERRPGDELPAMPDGESRGGAFLFELRHGPLANLQALRRQSAGRLPVLPELRPDCVKAGDQLVAREIVASHIRGLNSGKARLFKMRALLLGRNIVYNGPCLAGRSCRTAVRISRPVQSFSGALHHNLSSAPRRSRLIRLTPGGKIT